MEQKYLLKILLKFEKHYLTTTSEWIYHEWIAKNQPLKDASEGQDNCL